MKRSWWMVSAGILVLAAASCRWLRSAREAAPATQPAAAPSPEAIERQRQLAMLLEKIEDLERRLATSRPAATRPAPTAPVRLSPPVIADTGDVRMGVGGRAGLGPSDTPPLRLPPPAPTQEVTLKALIGNLETKSRSEPRNLTLKRQLRLLYLLDGRDEDALEGIEGAPEAEQTFWRQVMWALVNYLDDRRGLSANERAGAAYRALEEAMRTLARQAPLEVRNLTFCTEIRRFGDVTPLPANDFKPGQEALLYLELDGFASEGAPDRKSFRIVLRQQIELWSLRGDCVWTREFPDVEDQCSRPRRDLHFYSKFNFPDRVLPGQYVLKVIMTDCLSQKTAEESLTVTVR